MNDFVVWGPGELGRWFGGAALRLGMRVTPITRGMNPREAMAGLDHETPILVAVGESELENVLSAMPEVRKSSVLLLQNELFAPMWQRHHVRPTVMVPWLLKKRGQPELVHHLGDRVGGTPARRRSQQDRRQRRQPTDPDAGTQPRQRPPTARRGGECRAGRDHQPDPGALEVLAQVHPAYRLATSSA